MGKPNCCVPSIQEVQNGAAHETGWDPWFGPHKWLLHGFFRTEGPWRTARSPFSLLILPTPSGSSLVGTRSFFHVCERHGEMGLRRSWREVLTSQEASSGPPPPCLSLHPRILCFAPCVTSSGGVASASPRGLASAVTNQPVLGAAVGTERRPILSSARSDTGVGR